MPIYFLTMNKKKSYLLTLLCICHSFSYTVESSDQKIKDHTLSGSLSANNLHRVSVHDSTIKENTMSSQKRKVASQFRPLKMITGETKDSSFASWDITDLVKKEYAFEKPRIPDISLQRQFVETIFKDFNFFCKYIQIYCYL